MSIQDVTARISSIQSQFNSLSSMVPSKFSALGASSQVATSTAAQSATVGDFNSILSSTTEQGTTSTPGPTGQDAANLAVKYVGTPYVAGGRSPAGWDCAGFTQWVYKQLGVTIPDVSWEQIDQGQPVNDITQAKPGDLIMFHVPGGHHRDPDQARGCNHVAIYVGSGKIVEAANPSAGTRISDLPGYKIVGIRRIVPTTASPTLAATSAARPTTATTSADAVTPTITDSSSLTPRQLDQVLRKAGFTGDSLRVAWALAMRESGGHPQATGHNKNGTTDWGLFQINDVHRSSGWIDFSKLYDPTYNASVAYRMSSHGQDFSAWGVGTSGWAGHLARSLPQTYQSLNATFRKYYDAYPAQVLS